jgi:hypothetical protein
VLTVVVPYEKEQNTREIAYNGHTFVLHYEGDFSTRFTPLLQIKGVQFLGKIEDKLSNFKNSLLFVIMRHYILFLLDLMTTFNFF